MEYYAQLDSGSYYHIVNRAIGDEKLFRSSGNYAFFLSKFYKYLLTVTDIYAYALLPNHYHFLVKIKSIEELLRLRLKGKEFIYHDGWQSKFVMQHLSNFQNSYCKALNKTYNRKGALFMNSLRRKQITTDCHLNSIIFYIHKNPVHHGYCKAINEWGWSSYNVILSGNSSPLKGEEVLNWFGGKEGFIKYHNQPIDKRNNL